MFQFTQAQIRTDVATLDVSLDLEIAARYLPPDVSSPEKNVQFAARSCTFDRFSRKTADFYLLGLSRCGRLGVRVPHDNLAGSGAWPAGKHMIAEDAMKKKRKKPEESIEEIKRKRAERRRRRLWSKSKLIVVRAELVHLRAKGASFGDIQFWLKDTHRIHAARSTILRFLRKEQNSGS